MATTKTPQTLQVCIGGFMRGECNLFDVEILVDITVEFTSEDGLIVLDSVKWHGVELVEMIDQHVYDKIVEHIVDEEL